MVAESILLGLLAALMLGLGDVASIWILRWLGMLRFLLWAHVGVVAVATPYALFVVDFDKITPISLLAMALLGLFLFVAIATFYRSARLIGVSVAAPIASAHVAVTILLAVLFLGERLNSVQAAGIIIVALGIILSSRASHGFRADRRQKVGIALGITSMFIAGFFVFFLATLSREFGSFSLIYVMRISGLLIVVLYLWITRTNPWKGIPLRFVPIALLIGLFQASGLGFYALATQVGQVSIAVTAFCAYPIVSMLGGVLLLRERLVTRQAVGLVLAIGGLFVLSIAT